MGDMERGADGGVEGREIWFQGGRKEVRPGY